jgi:hypothetical protein
LDVDTASPTGVNMPLEVQAKIDRISKVFDLQTVQDAAEKVIDWSPDLAPEEISPTIWALLGVAIFVILILAFVAFFLCWRSCTTTGQTITTVEAGTARNWLKICQFRSQPLEKATVVDDLLLMDSGDSEVVTKPGGLSLQELVQGQAGDHLNNFQL